jgi:xylan 1,4-beta-xylosidase
MRRRVKARQGLERMEPDRQVAVEDGHLELTVDLPLPSVSLLVLTARP